MAASLHQISAVQMIKSIVILSVFFIPLSLFSQTNDDEIITTEWYN
jgi:hypothetical protein